MLESFYKWFTAVLMLVVYVVGVCMVVVAMAREVCAAEFYLDLGPSGQLRVFDMTCATDKTKMGAYLLPKAGKKIWACWEFGNDKVHVWFNDGSYLAFPWSDMRPVIDGTEFVPPQAPKHPQRKRYIET